MQLSTLKTFVMLADQKSFSKTAKLLYVSQPALTQQIQKLEQELGFSLIDRRQHRVFTLTPAGEHFYTFARKTLVTYENVMKDCRVLAGLSRPHIVIGIDRADTILLKTSTVARYTQENPDIDLEISYGMQADLMNRLLMENCDAVFLPERNEIPEDTIYYPVVEDGIGCVMTRNNPLAKKKVLKLKDLENQLIRLPSGNDSKVCRQLQEILQYRFTSVRLHPYTTISFASREHDNEIYITSLHNRILFHEMVCIPLESSLHVSYGYIVRKDCPDAVRSFIRMNQEAAD